MTSDKTGRRVAMGAAMLAGATFAVDLLVPMGHAEWVLYLVAILLGARVLGNRGTVAFVGICSVLTVAGNYLGLHGAEPDGSLIDRSVGIVVFWLTAWLVLSGRRTRQAKVLIQQSHDELERRVVERTNELGHTVATLQQEVRDRLRAEGTLQKSEENLRAILSSLHETAIAVYDTDGNILNVWIDRKLLEKYGLDLGNLVGKTLWDIHPPEIARARIDRIGEVAATGRSVRDEYLTRYPKGSYWMETTLTPMQGPAGRSPAVVAFIRDITGAREAQLALQSAHRKLMTAIEDERRRLARELHDSVAQDLVAMELSLHNAGLSLGGQAGQAEATRVLHEGVVRCQQVVEEIRGICHGLYPPTLEMFGLIPSMEQLASRCREAGLAGRLEVGQEVGDRRFAPDVEIAVFHIAQEAVGNALRHSQGKSIGLTLRVEQDRLVLTVRDDGKGFAPGRTPAQGLGLVSMRERAEAVGGELVVDSDEGGTTVFLSTPTGPG